MGFISINEVTMFNPEVNIVTTLIDCETLQISYSPKSLSHVQHSKQQDKD